MRFLIAQLWRAGAQTQVAIALVDSNMCGEYRAGVKALGVVAKALR